MSYLHSEYIPIAMFEPILEAELNYELELLKQYSLISLDEGKHELNIHKLVQEVIHIDGESKSKERSVLDKTLELLGRIKEIKDSKGKNQYYIDPHISSVWEYAYKYPDLIEKWFIKNNKDFNRGELLGLLVRSDSSEIVRAIIEYVNDNHPNILSDCVNAREKDGETALSEAAYHGELELVKYLVGKGANLEIKNTDGMYPLHLACQAGEQKIVEFLIDSGAKIDQRSSNGMTALHFAAQAGQLDVVRYLMENKGMNFVNVGQDEAGMTPLHCAAEYGKLNVVKYLLEKEGSFLNSKDRLDMTPVHLASFNGHLGVVEYLVSQGANIEIPDNEGMTALHNAIDGEKLEVVRYLIENNAQIFVPDNDNYTPMDLAIQIGDRDIIDYIADKITEFFIRSAHEQNERGGVNISPLHLTAQHGYTDVVKRLIDRGYNVNVPDENGNTPLHKAAQLGNRDVLKYMVESEKGGINLNACNSLDLI